MSKKYKIEFCDKILCRNSKISYKIDSICIPCWNGLNEIENSTLLKSAILCPNNHLSQIKDTTNAAFIVEQTEDGIEIMIYLGDMFISKEE